jgi:DNA-binding NtrC family response regulator
VDVRFIAATNHDLQEATQTGKFRVDLFYRLRETEIALPPLCERKEDIPLLIQHFLQNAAQNMRNLEISDEAMELLVKYHWPGNVRELQHCIRSTVVLADSNVIRPEDLPPEVKSRQSPEATQEGVLIKSGTKMAEAEKAIILMTLKETGGNRTKAAELLGISLRTIQNRVKEYESEG